MSPNAKVSDGSQPQSALNPSPGEPAGCRSLDRHGWARYPGSFSSSSRGRHRICAYQHVKFGIGTRREPEIPHDGSTPMWLYAIHAVAVGEPQTARHAEREVWKERQEQSTQHAHADRRDPPSNPEPRGASSEHTYQGQVVEQRDHSACRSILIAQRQGQRREPATRSADIATRRAGWHTFAGPPWFD
jgi:hypothetical protein